MMVVITVEEKSSIVLIMLNLIEQSDRLSNYVYAF